MRSAAGGAEASEQLQVPADPTYSALVRVFAGGVGRIHGLEPSSVEDLKLALTELCGAAAGSGQGEPMTIEIGPASGGLEVICDGPIPVAMGDAAEGDHRQRLLEALIPDARIRRKNGSTSVSFLIA